MSPPPSQKTSSGLEKEIGQILGIAFFAGTVAEAVGAVARTGGCALVVATPALLKLNYDAEYRAALQRADFVLADSNLLACVWRWVAGGRVPVISGLDYLRALLAAPSFQSATKLWVVDSEREQIDAAAFLNASQLKTSLDDFHVMPGGSRSNDRHALLLRIEERKPQHVVLALRGGGQEELALYLREYLLYRPAIHGIGAAVALSAGTEKPISRWSQHHALGWLSRFAAQPRLIIPRILIALGVVTMLLRYRENLPPLRERWTDL